MKKALLLTLALTSLALATPAVRAQNYTSGDLLIGFEAGTTTSVVFNLGAAQSFVTATTPFSINLGNLNSALISAFGGTTPGNNANIFAAVFGNLNPNDPSNTLYASQPHSNALSGSAQSSRSSNMSAVESTYSNLYAGNRAVVMNSATDGNNTYVNFVVGGRVFQNYITEQQFNVGSMVIDRLPSTTNGGGPVSTLGTLTFGFDGSGNITSAQFAPVPEPSTYALLAAGLVVAAVIGRRRIADARTRASA